MPKTFEDPNPHISILDDGQTKKRIANAAKHALEMADMLKTAPPPSKEQWERERFQYASNEYALQNPMYAAARGSTSFLVLPLEPNGVTPMVELSEATKDDRQLFEWWQTWPDANPGILLGRIGGVFALKVDDLAAYVRLREMARYETYEEDRDTTTIHYREIGGASVLLLAPSEPVSYRTRTGWGRAFNREIAKMLKDERERQPQTFWLLFSYHSPVSGQDAWDFKRRTILPGVTVVGEGEVIPYNGAILEGGVTVSGIAQSPPEVPIWLAQSIGRARSRKVMAAAREQYEASMRAINPRAVANEALWRRLEEEARVKAEEDRRRAEKILADEMAKGQ
jgi:hypothetical protein